MRNQAGTRVPEDARVVEAQGWPFILAEALSLHPLPEMSLPCPDSFFPPPRLHLGLLSSLHAVVPSEPVSPLCISREASARLYLSESPRPLLSLVQSSCSLHDCTSATPSLNPCR